MKTKPFKTFQDVVDFSVEYNGESKEFDCKFDLVIEGVKYSPYTVSIANRDLLFYFEEGTANYLIDSYGDDNRAELFDLTLDAEEEVARLWVENCSM